MKRLFILFALLTVCAGLSLAQGITTSGGGFTITAAVGDAQCVFTGPHIIDSGTITCLAGRVQVLFTLWHVAVGHSISGMWNFPRHAIAWTLTHLSPGSNVGSFGWSISIDGGPPQTGTF